MKNRKTIRTTVAVVTCDHWLRPPAVSTMAVLVGLPLTTKVLLQPAAALASETDQVHILAEVVAITESVGARGGGALSEDDNETGKGNGENQSDVGPRHTGQAEAG